MSVQTTETTSTLRFTEALLAYLNVLARGREGDRLEIHSRSEGGLGYQALHAAVPRQPWSALPDFALKLLEAGWAARISAAARDSSGTLRSLAVLFATFPIPLRFSQETGWHHAPDEAAVADALARLDRFALPPAFVVDGFREILGVWPLSEPLTDLDHVRRLQRKLALTLNASTAPVTLAIPSATIGGGRSIEYPADDPAAHLVLPGTIVREAGSPVPIVTFAVVAPDHIYPVADIEATLGGQKETPG